MEISKPRALAALAAICLLALPSAARAGETQETPQAQGHDPAHHMAGPQAQEPGDQPTLRHQGPAEHSFAGAEQWAERFDSPERDRWQLPDKVVAELAVHPGMTVADIGSGTGYFASRFAVAVAPGGTVLGSDLESDMAVYLRGRAEREQLANLVPVLASADDPRLPDGTVDLVFICNTWHHIHDRIDYARRLRADLAPGGRVAIVDFLPGELPVGPGPEHKLTAEQVSAEFAAAGYRPAGSLDFLPYQYVLVFE